MGVSVGVAWADKEAEMSQTLCASQPFSSTVNHESTAFCLDGSEGCEGWAGELS